MKSQITTAIIIAIGLIVGGLLIGGRFSVTSIGGGSIARVDRFTGRVALCIPGTSTECEWLMEPPTGQTARMPPTLTDDQVRALDKAGLTKNSN